MWRRRGCLRQWRQVIGHGERHVVSRGRNLDLTEYKLPAGAATVGRKILFFSDLHWQDNHALATEMVELCRAVNPDWLIYGGDLISYSCHLQPAVDLLKRLPARMGKLCVPGNWDRKRRHWFPEERWRMIMADAGFNYLNNQSFDTSDGWRFWGTDDLRMGSPQFEPATVRPPFQVLITHNPDAVVELDHHLEGIDLVLCGHTHGGQIRLPGIGPLYTSSRYWRKFAYGLFHNDRTGTCLIVSSGIGSSSVDIRLGCPREMVLIRFV